MYKIFGLEREHFEEDPIELEEENELNLSFFEFKIFTVIRIDNNF